MKRKTIVAGLALSSLLSFAAGSEEIEAVQRVERRWAQHVHAGLIDYQYSLGVSNERVVSKTSGELSLPLSRLSLGLQASLDSEHAGLGEVIAADIGIGISVGPYLANENAIVYLRGLARAVEDLKARSLSGSLGLGVGGAFRHEGLIVEVSAEYAKVFLAEPSEQARVNARVVSNKLVAELGLRTEGEQHLEYSAKGLYEVGSGFIFGLQAGNGYGAALLGYDFRGLTVLGRVSTLGEIGLEMRADFGVRGD
jgi:hypothetical protein